MSKKTKTEYPKFGRILPSSVKIEPDGTIIVRIARNYLFLNKSYLDAIKANQKKASK